MNRIILFTILFFYLVTFNLNAQIINVKQDGSGDFIIIQDAINATLNGDTILVWPGTYYENLNFNGKSITLSSLNLLTNDPVYIYQTIVDGNQAGRCILAEMGVSVTIQGFTITNGNAINQVPSGDGGGISVLYSQAIIKNCIILKNKARYAGGLELINSPAFLSGLTISNNEALVSGGGLLMGGDSVNWAVTFDSVNRCSIYLNFAGEGCDIWKGYTADTLFIPLDTFTVINPDDYHIFQGDYHGYPIQKLKMNIRHAKISTLAADLFVSPLGSNENSGQSPDQPLKTLAFALAKIISSPDTIRTVHLANGLYANSSNQEHFPVNLRSNINIVGEHRDSTILDADSVTFLVLGSQLEHNYSLRSLTLQRGNGRDDTDPTSGINISANYNVLFKDLLIKRCNHYFASAFNNGASINVILENVETSQCKRGDAAMRAGGGNDPMLGLQPDTITFVNCKVQHTEPGNDPNSGTGGAFDILGKMGDNSFIAYLINCEVTENLALLPLPYYLESGILASENCTVYVVNSTIGNNKALFNPDNSAIGIQRKSKMYIFNSILYGNIPRQIGVAGAANVYSELYIYNSVVQGGKDSIFNTNSSNIIYYDLTNINANPLWDTASMYPYSLAEGSLCIDAGTLDLPPGITLPEYDLAGNTRVYGTSVDMGAYEYGPWVGIPTVPNSKFKIQNSKLIEVSPNPFSNGTYVSYELKENGRVNISVYSISGMKVKTLVNNTGSVGDKGSFYWEGRDQSGQSLPTGVYFIRMTMDGKEMETVKVVRK